MVQQRSADASCDQIDSDEYAANQVSIDTGVAVDWSISWDDPGGDHLVGLYLCDSTGNVIAWKKVTNGETGSFNFPTGSSNLVVGMSTKPGETRPASMHYRIGLQPHTPPTSNPIVVTPIVLAPPWMGALDVAYLDPFW